MNFPGHPTVSALDLLLGEELQFPQTPAAFNTPFSQITIEKLIQTLSLFYPTTVNTNQKAYRQYILQLFYKRCNARQFNNFNLRSVTQFLIVPNKNSNKVTKKEIQIRIINKQNKEKPQKT